MTATAAACSSHEGFSFIIHIYQAVTLSEALNFDVSTIHRITSAPFHRCKRIARIRRSVESLDDK